MSPILAERNAVGFWLAVLLTGVGTGLGAAALTELLQLVQHAAWSGNGTDLLDAAATTAPWRHVVILMGAGLLTGAGQLLLRRLSAANSIDITAAIWFHAGRLPALRTLGSAVLSILVVGMGASLGREGAPKQTGAVIANELSETMQLADDQRRLLVACGAGAGMAAAYGVPLGGALFALEVLRGELACQCRPKSPQKRRSKIPHFRRSGHWAGVAILGRPTASAWVGRRCWRGDDRLRPDMLGHEFGMLA